MNSPDTVYHWCIMMGFGEKAAEQAKRNVAGALENSAWLDAILGKFGGR